MRAIADVVVAGAGAAGLATAHFLKRILPNSKVILFSRHPPFALTSSARLARDLTARVDTRLVALIVVSARNAFAIIGLRLQCAPL